MSLPTLDRLLLVCVLGCATIIISQYDVLGAVPTCDNKCRYVSIYVQDQGNGSYNCHNLQNVNDCWTCTTTGTTSGGCDNTLALQNGTCKEDKSMPQQDSLSTNCNLWCPLPQSGKTQGTATTTKNWLPFGWVYNCRIGS
jgi:hypothetical protein